MVEWLQISENQDQVAPIGAVDDPCLTLFGQAYLSENSNLMYFMNSLMMGITADQPIIIFLNINYCSLNIFQVAKTFAGSL